MGGVAGLAVFFPNFSALLLLAHLLIILTLGAMAMLGLRRFRKLAETASTSGPKVSIIVPVKDEQDTVKDALESLIGLDYGNRRSWSFLAHLKMGHLGFLRISGQGFGLSTSRQSLRDGWARVGHAIRASCNPAEMYYCSQMEMSYMRSKACRVPFPILKRKVSIFCLHGLGFFLAQCQKGSSCPYGIS